jgi:hypothetical protein
MPQSQYVVQKLVQPLLTIMYLGVYEYDNDVIVEAHKQSLLALFCTCTGAELRRCLICTVTLLDDCGSNIHSCNPIA